jgi:hypothetical protein
LVVLRLAAVARIWHGQRAIGRVLLEGSTGIAPVEVAWSVSVEACFVPDGSAERR